MYTVICNDVSKLSRCHFCSLLFSRRSVCAISQTHRHVQYKRDSEKRLPVSLGFPMPGSKRNKSSQRLFQIWICLKRQEELQKLRQMLPESPNSVL